MTRKYTTKDSVSVVLRESQLISASSASRDSASRDSAFQDSPFREIPPSDNISATLYPASNNVPPKRRPRKKISDPELYSIWRDLYLEYFPQRSDLADYQVVWANNKRKRTLASCNLRRLRVTVASELRHEKHHQWLSPLLYHEMCHAVLHFEVGRNGRGMRWHGPEFRELEVRHPQIDALNHWAKNGGWLGAIRSDRARKAHQKRKELITKNIINPSASATTQLRHSSQIIIKRRLRTNPPAQTPSGQFLLFLRSLKRKLIG